MKQYDVNEAKARFSELVNMALVGEEVVIARGNKPLVKLTPLSGATKEQAAPEFEPPEDINEYS